MILVDTSIWIDHLRKADARLGALLNAGEVLTHPFVVGEVSLGNLADRTTVLDHLDQLPGVDVASDDEVRLFIDRHALCSRCIGYIDTHLLAAVALTPGTLLWSRDKRLRTVAESLGQAAIY